MFLDRGSGRYATSDEDDAFESPGTQRRAVSVDEFLRGSELGKQVSGQCLGPCVPRFTPPLAPSTAQGSELPCSQVLLLTRGSTPRADTDHSCINADWRLVDKDQPLLHDGCLPGVVLAPHPV